MAITKTTNGGSTYTAFTPVWKGESSDPAIGNGTMVGYKKYIGDELHLLIMIKMGSTTTYGTGQWYFTLPDSKSAKFDPSTTLPRSVVGTNYADDIGTALKSGVSIVDLSDPTKLKMAFGGTSGDLYGPAAPMTWADTDWLSVNAVIPVA